MIDSPEGSLGPFSLTLVRDSYFESLVREREGSVSVGEYDFDPSEVIRLDPDVYKELRSSYLDEAYQRISKSLSPVSLRRFEKLVERIPKRGVVPFIGAGMSASSGAPTWADFLACEARGYLGDEIIVDRLAAYEFEELAEDILSARGAGAFNEALEVFDVRSAPSEVLHLVLKSFQESIITTNFDGLIESCLRAIDSNARVVEGCGSWRGWAHEGNSGRERLVLKLHGHYSRPNFRVLLRAEYEREYGDSGDVRRDLLDIFSSNVVVFLGCSLGSDRTLEIAREVSEMKGPRMPSHYAFVADPGEDESAWRRMREKFLNARGIFPIWYPNESGGHELLADMLWWVSESVNVQ